MSCAYWIEEWVEAIRQRNEARDWAKILFREWNKLVRENERLNNKLGTWRVNINDHTNLKIERDKLRAELDARDGRKCETCRHIVTVNREFGTRPWCRLESNECAPNGFDEWEAKA